MAPPGRQKSERAFCLFGGVFLRPACRAVCRGGRSCAACRCCGGFCARCPVFFLPVCRCLVPGLRLSAVFCLACAACLPFGRRRLCFRLAGSLPLLCLARAAGACLPFARRALCVHGFSLLFFLFPASLLPLKNLFICRSGRDGPLLSSEKKVDKDSRGGAVAPPSNPHSCALRPIFVSSALLAGLAAIRPQTAGR